MGSKNSRYRPSAGHIMLELLYGSAAWINRPSANEIDINISHMAKGLHMRPVRLIGCLEWLASQRLIEDLQIGRYKAQMKYKVPSVGTIETKQEEARGGAYVSKSPDCPSSDVQFSGW